MSATNTAIGFSPRILAQSTVRAEIVAPKADIDISDWLFNIDELEYNNCTPKSRAHISAGFTHAPDGRKMSINVEYIAGALFVQHYAEEIGEKLHCRVQSTSTLLMNNVFTTVHIMWELIAEQKAGDRHEFTNSVRVQTTREFEENLAANNIPYEEARKSFQQGVDCHNHEEAPEFAASIQRKALKRGK